VAKYLLGNGVVEKKWMMKKKKKKKIMIMIMMMTMMMMIIIKTYSFYVLFSKLEHIAHYKAKNQSTVKTNIRVSRIACRGEISTMIGKT